MAAVSARRPTDPVPSYKEMILAAIGSLREKNGSSEPAIAAYIASKYKDTPPIHNALLSRHLSDLKKQGIIETVQSYKIAAKAGENTGSNASKRRGRPKKNLSQVAMTSPSSEKRKPGRPHKAVSGPTIILPQHMKAVMKADKSGSVELGEKRIRGRPKRFMDMAVKSSPGKPKRKPGRPMKTLALLVASAGKRKRGRPFGFSPLSSQKRRPGRPKKGSGTTPMLVPNAAETAPVTSGTPASGEKRKRGRPYGFSPRVPSSSAKPSSSGKPRGRPPKTQSNVSNGVKNADQKKPSSGSKRRGRPAKIKSIASIETNDVVEKVEKVDHTATAGNGEVGFIAQDVNPGSEEAPPICQVSAAVAVE